MDWGLSARPREEVSDYEYFRQLGTQTKAPFNLIYTRFDRLIEALEKNPDIEREVLWKAALQLLNTEEFQTACKDRKNREKEPLAIAINIVWQMRIQQLCNEVRQQFPLNQTHIAEEIAYNLWKGQFEAIAGSYRNIHDTPLSASLNNQALLPRFWWTERVKFELGKLLWPWPHIWRIRRKTWTTPTSWVTSAIWASTVRKNPYILWKDEALKIAESTSSILNTPLYVDLNKEVLGRWSQEIEEIRFELSTLLWSWPHIWRIRKLKSVPVSQKSDFPEVFWKELEWTVIGNLNVSSEIWQTPGTGELPKSISRVTPAMEASSMRVVDEEEIPALSKDDVNKCKEIIQEIFSDQATYKRFIINCNQHTSKDELQANRNFTNEEILEKAINRFCLARQKQTQEYSFLSRRIPNNPNINKVYLYYYFWIIIEIVTIVQERLWERKSFDNNQIRAEVFDKAQRILKHIVAAAQKNTKAEGTQEISEFSERHVSVCRIVLRTLREGKWIKLETLFRILIWQESEKMPLIKVWDNLWNLISLSVGKCGGYRTETKQILRPGIKWQINREWISGILGRLRAVIDFYLQSKWIDKSTINNWQELLGALKV